MQKLIDWVTKPLRKLDEVFDKMVEDANEEIEHQRKQMGL